MTTNIDGVRKQLREAMKAKGVSQRELARRLGVSEARVSQMFSENSSFSMSSAERGSAALGMEFDLKLSEATDLP